MLKHTLQIDFPNYFASRDRFRAAAGRLGCTVEQQAIASMGPAGEPLTIDVARWGESSAGRVVVISSGLHGVEGPFGSAVQSAWLNACADEHREAPPGTAIVLIHALNPWGFFHERRTDAGNVDLNRSFLLQGEPYEGSPSLYARLDRDLNPPAPPRQFDLFALLAITALLRHGRSAVAQAVAAGQYAYPRGLFFGGRKESDTARLLRDCLPRWLGNGSHVLHLDFHTGLGPWATHSLLADYQLSEDERRIGMSLTRAGGRLIEPEQTPAGFYRSRGSLGSWCKATFPDRRYLLLVAEFGTYPPVKVLSALRRENQAHHFCRPEDPRSMRAKQRLREVFCPASARWREACLAQGLALIRAAIETG